MRAADARPADMRPTDMRPTDTRPTDMRRPKATTAAVPAKPAEMSAPAAPANAMAATIPATMPAATVPAATVSAATAARVCFECEKRHDEEQHRGQASAGRQHQLHGAAGLGAPRCCGRLSLGLGILPRTKSF